MREETGRILGFDGLRGLAVLLVLFTHKFESTPAYGHMGVWLFLVLSGFLIVRILARARDEIETGENDRLGALASFFARRITRLWPIYYGVLTLCALAGLVGASPIPAAEAPFIWLHVTNLMIAARDQFSPIDHLWTLAVEEQFYLLAAPLILLVPRRYTLSLCACVVVIGLTVKTIMHAGGASPLQVYVNSWTNFALLALGGVVGLIAHRPLPALLVSGGAQIAMLTLYLLTYAALSTLGVSWLIAGQLMTVFAGLLLLQIFQGQRTWFVGILESLPLRPIGRISYGLYLYQGFIYLAPVGSPRAPWAIAEVCVTFVVAALSWRFIEQPLISWSRRAQVSWRQRRAGQGAFTNAAAG